MSQLRVRKPRAVSILLVLRNGSECLGAGHRNAEDGVQARVLARRGDHHAAAALAREAVGIMAKTDYLVHHGLTLVHLAHVLREGGREAEAIESASEALDLFRRKGASFLVELTQQLVDDWTG